MITVNNEKYYTPAEYAKHSNVSLKTVYNRINSGDLKTRKILGKTVVKG